MRDLQTVKKNRNNLQYAISNILHEISRIKNNRAFNELIKEEKWQVGQLCSLRDRYSDQRKALDFVLNEDSKLNDYRGDRNYEGVGKEFFANLNVE